LKFFCNFAHKCISARETLISHFFSVLLYKLGLHHDILISDISAIGHSRLGQFCSSFCKYLCTVLTIEIVYLVQWRPLKVASGLRKHIYSWEQTMVLQQMPRFPFIGGYVQLEPQFVSMSQPQDGCLSFFSFTIYHLAYMEIAVFCSSQCNVWFTKWRH